MMMFVYLYEIKIVIDMTYYISFMHMNIYPILNYTRGCMIFSVTVYPCKKGERGQPEQLYLRTCRTYKL